MTSLVAEPTLGPTTLPHFLVKQLKPQRHGLNEADLVQKVQEIEIQTQIAGASFLVVHIIDSDPLWRITNSGLIKVGEDGLLNQLVVEFPEKTGFLWRLSRAEGNTEIAAPSLILTFEDMVVQRLRERWGHKTVKPGTTTRAQFVQQLVEEANLLGHLNPPIRFHSAGINRIEPIAEAKPTKTKAGAAAAKAKELKERGIHAGAEIKIKGQGASPTQRAILNECLTIAAEHNATELATVAMIETVITENTVSNSGEGLFQVEPSTAASKGVTKGNVKSETEGFLLKGYAISEGAIAYANGHPNAPAYEVAQAIQGSGAGRASKGAANYGPHKLEAETIVHAFGGVTPGGTAAHKPEKSDVGQLTRGVPASNPDEDSWECIQRLAQQVRWFAFTDGRNTLFYMDGPDLRGQRPVCYINPTHVLPTGDITSHVIKEDKGGQRIEEFGVLIQPLNWTFDNTTFEYQATHKVKQRIQRRSKISKPTTPSELRLLMLCGITEFRAGDVFVFRHCGPISENGGRWIIADATRECMKYPYTKFILVPPTEPLPEPKEEASPNAAGMVAPPFPGAAGYVNPLAQIKNLSPARIDMGVDYGGTGVLVALGDAEITFSANHSGWEGGGVVVYKLTAGPLAGKYVYVAEGVVTTIEKGTKVKAGQGIATMTGGIETGWASGNADEPLAAKLGQQGAGDPGGVESPAGRSFNTLLTQLGAPSGTKNSGGLSTHGQPMPAGYP